MPHSRRRFLALGTGAGLALLAGCVGRSNSPDPPTASRTTTADRTSIPEGTVEFPDGPKERPEKPDDLTEGSVREFVRSYEYNLVYNRLWYDDTSDVELSCEVTSIERPGDHYRVRVSCTGYSNTGGSKPNSTATATVVHADWFTQAFLYLVDESSTIRRRPDERTGTTG